ncbi:PQQ-dependent sugar dehydrogenase [Reichenbachiella sp. MALMAid0571]|uniref:PQQ-dependent sugar dehydrogenase n=1 Tax=Reichenbachiella sp. MALMAid0571 TaxID=3143939 RepID=UPI0032DE50E0
MYKSFNFQFRNILLCLIIFGILIRCQSQPEEVEQPDEHRFKITVLTEEAMNPTAISIAENNKVYFAEDYGNIKVYDPKTKNTSIVGTLSVFKCGEEGLIGMVLDPDFAHNGWIYINRTISDYMNLPCSEVYRDPKRRHEDSSSNQSISRFTIIKDTLDMESEKILLNIPNQHMRHIGGSMAFDGAGNLYISVGENTHPGFINPYAPLDERPGRSRFDTQRTSSNTMDYRGKILRIHPEKDGTYTIPNGNLFAKDDTLALPEIFVMGCRNPFRISVDKESGTLYWGEVGPDAYADTERGPKGYDEINKTTTGGFFGWPYFIADNQAYSRYDYDTEKAGEHFDFNNPVNNSPNNTGKKILPPAKPAFIWYPYAPSPEFPKLGEGGRSAMSGPVYHYNAGNNSDIKFPSYFDNALFIYDWMRGWIKLVRIDKNGELQKIEDFMPSTRFIGPIDMQFGMDGALYVMEFGTTWGDNPDARLIKIEYIKGNRPPHVEITADNVVGKCPLTVNFSSSGTIDYDKNEQLTYSWQFDSNKIQSTEKNASFVFQKPGNYIARLTVTDSHGAATTQALEIKAGNGKPEISIEIPDRGSFYWNGDKIPYEIFLEDEEDGSLKNGKIKASQVQVSLERVKGVYTIEQSTTGVSQLKSPGEKLIGESDCKSCHKVNKRAIGPSFIEVSEKYKNDSKAPDYLANKILAGGSGVWGDINMSAHPLFSEAEALSMADYILSLAEGNQNVKPVPTKGFIQIPEDIESGENITYILKASYTDKGTTEMDPITTTAIRTIQNPKLQAENFSTMHDLLSESGDKMVFMGFSSTYISFKNIDLNNVDSITFRYNYKGPECFITVKLDSATGKSIGKAQFIGDLKKRGVKELTIPIEPTQGNREIFFLHSKAPDIHEEIGLDWIYFH